MTLRPFLRSLLLRLCLPLAAAGAWAASGPGSAPAPSSAPGAAAAPVQAHVLRYALRAAETSFDPAAINDLYSRSIAAHVFEGLYDYDPLARPARLRPRVAAAMPEVDAEWRVWTVRLQPGIRFQDDPVFRGKPRELVAADLVYALKRFADPAVQSPNWGYVEQWGILGLAGARRRAQDGVHSFDYDRELPGVRALDRYTVRFELAASRPRFIELLTGNDLLVPMAREVVEAYGPSIGAHPVGTGPFRLAEWRRASRIVLERNPAYRVLHYDAQPAADDAEGQAILQRLRGRPLPLLDRVEVAIIEQNQPRWLSFLNGEADFIDRVPEDFIDTALPGGHLAPALAARGVQSFRELSPDVLLTLFNMDDPVVGGYTPDKVALRRAIALGVDRGREAQLARHGQMLPAQSLLMPHTTGYDPAFRSEMGVHDPVRARALLDLYGYIDRDGDGWRDQPDGQPLTLVIANQDDQAAHLLGELWQRNLQALGLRVQFRIARWPENLKAARAGRLQMWGVAVNSQSSDGQQALERLYGPSAGGNNLARFRNAEFDDVYRRLLVLPDGPERQALFTQAKRISTAWMPYIAHGHRIVTDLAWPQLLGYRRQLFSTNWWEYVDVVPPAASTPAAPASASAPR